MKSFAPVVTVVALSIGIPAFPAPAQVNTTALATIKAAAVEMCQPPSDRVTNTTVGGQADVKGTFSKLLRKLVNLGFDVGANASWSESTNVLQSDLEKDRESYRKCIATVFGTFYNSTGGLVTPGQTEKVSSGGAVKRSRSRSNRTDNGPPVLGPAPTLITKFEPTRVTAPCSRLASLGAQIWRERYLRPVRKDTWHVFVQSLGMGSTEEDAATHTAAFQKKYPYFDFNIMSTVAPDNSSNFQWAVVMGEGLTYDEAKAVADAARSCGVARDAYLSKQPWDVD